MEDVDASAASGASSMRVVTVSGEEIGHLIPAAAAQIEQPQEPQPPNGLEYRIDGEVVQLTRVPQDEAMRLVNSGATVIHVEQEAMPGTGPPDPLTNDPTAAVASTSSGGGVSGGRMHLQQQQPQHPPQPPEHSQQLTFNNGRALNTNYDLPAELVQVLVDHHRPQPQQASTVASAASNQDEDWINAYRRQQ